MRAIVLAVLACALVVGGSAHAQTADKKAPPPAPALAAPLHGGALLHVSAEIAQGIGQIPAGAIVVASAIASDIPAPKGDELAVRIATQVAGKIGVAKAHAQPAALAVARGLSGRAASLVYLQLEIAKGELRVTADLYPVVSNSWERLRNPVPGPRAHAFAMAPLDAEVRGFLTPVLLEQATIHKVRHEEGEVVAVGCGDVDGDGGNELVLVTRQRVSIAKLRGGKLVVQRTAPWNTIASRVPVPMREPIGSVLVSPPGHRGEILLGTTDRGGVVVDATLVAKRQLTGLPVPGGDGDACTVASADASAFEGNAIACDLPLPPEKPAAPVKGKSTKVEPVVMFAAPVARYDAVAALDAVGRDGSVAQILAVREPNGRLRLRRQDPGGGRPVEATLEGAGAQLALVDLDLDGIPEIVTTSDTSDELLLVSSFARGLVTPRLRFPARDGVRAIAVCPPEEKGVPGLVAVVGNEVWLVR